MSKARKVIRINKIPVDSSSSDDEDRHIFKPKQIQAPKKISPPKKQPKEQRKYTKNAEKPKVSPELPDKNAKKEEVRHIKNRDIPAAAKSESDSDDDREIIAKPKKEDQSVQIFLKVKNCNKKYIYNCMMSTKISKIKEVISKSFPNTYEIQVKYQKNGREITARDDDQIEFILKASPSILKKENVIDCLYVELKNKVVEVDIDEYEKSKVIGRGQSAIVYLAKHKETSEKVAAKCLLRSETNEYDDIVIDNHEIAILKDIEYPSIVKLLGYSKYDFDGNENLTIFLKLGKEKSLGKYLSDSRRYQARQLTSTQCQIIMIGTAAAMDCLNSKNVMHRDLKPDNILLDKKYRPMVTDFGIAKYFKNGIGQTPAIGSPSYEAPEVIEGKDYDCKADVFSFGVIMYEIITGLNPYGPKCSSFFILANVPLGLRPDLENIANPLNLMNKYFKKLIMRCFHENPDKRPDFKTILMKLAFDKKYYLEGVNESEVLNYVKNVLKIKK